jgi:hypothetical protein
MAYGPSLIHGYSLHTDLSRMTNDELATDLRLRERKIHRTDSLIDCYDGEKVKIVALGFYGQIIPSQSQGPGSTDLLERDRRLHIWGFL